MRVDKSILRVSRYTFPIFKDNTYLVYNARTNDFFEIDDKLYLLLTSFSVEKLNDWDQTAIQILLDKHILSTEEEDDLYVDRLLFQHNLLSYDVSNIKLTIAPTVSCNLRCPYCFEKMKPQGIITKDICDDIITFIYSHKSCKTVSICWYGGEPLLAPNRIEYFLEELTRRGEIKLVNHSILTNATLLTTDVINIFEKYPLDFLQLTLDGVKEQHDLKRVTHDGKGTYDLILDNISAFISKCPKTRVSFRVNVDKSNADSFIDLVSDIKNRFGNSPRVNIYPGILRNYSDCEQTDLFFSSNDTLQFYNLLEAKGIPQEVYPQQRFKGCGATSVGAYVIGPHGELYNCWEDMGSKNAVIGNVRNSAFSLSGSFLKYIRYGTPFTDPKCAKCGLLPICNGGCPKKRLLNKFNHENHDLCYVYAQNDFEALNEFLFRFFLKTKHRK